MCDSTPHARVHTTRIRSVVRACLFRNVSAEGHYSRSKQAPHAPISQDGYAVIAVDGVGDFEVLGESRAGACQSLV
jgi:hypothetical protein